MNNDNSGSQVMRASVPIVPNLGDYAIDLARIVAKTSYLPDPKTVYTIGGAVFPTIRDSVNRTLPIKDALEVIVGMYDDNTTPRWALLWAHGIAGKAHPTGWTFAHVWPSRGDLEAYTHLANLAMIPECFGSLTDKAGPLTHFLRWHAWSVYNWKPSGEPEPRKPGGYDEIVWNYFPGITNPREFVHAQVQKAGCQRAAILKPLMQRTSTK